MSLPPQSAYPLSPLASAAVRMVHGVDRKALLGAIADVLGTMGTHISVLLQNGFSKQKFVDAVLAIREAFLHRSSLMESVLDADVEEDAEGRQQQAELDSLLRTFYEATLALEDRMSTFQSNTLTPNILKMRKLDKRLALVKAAWHEILLFLSLSVAWQSKSQASTTFDQLAKLAIATGYPDWEEFKNCDGASLLLQGDKYLLGIGSALDSNGSESRTVVLTDQAMQRYELAAHQCNHPPAQYMLGWVYEHGAGRAQDLPQAVHYYQTAATNNQSPAGPSSEAMTALGRLFMSGKGVPRNMSKAVEWYLKAAEQGCPAAMTALAQLLEKGLVARSILSSQDATPQTRSRSPTQPESYTKVILKKDEAKAMDYYRQAMKKQHTPAFHGLACLYLRNSDYANAVPLFRQAAADHHYPPSMNRLGMCYEQGQGVLRDHVLAKHWYEQASRRGHANGTSNLAYLYLTEKKYAKAYELFNLAATKGNHPDALFHLGQMHEQGVSLAHSTCAAGFESAATASAMIAQEFELPTRVDRTADTGDIEDDYHPSGSGDSNALFFLPSNQVLAFRYFLQAANHPTNPHQYALVKCGEYFLFGIAEPSSSSTPGSDNTVSIATQAPDSQTKKRHFLQPNMFKAARYLERAVDLFDSPHAMLRLGQLAELGLGQEEGTGSDIPAAKQWYQRAIAKGHGPAFYHLGAMFESGLAQVPADEKAAFSAKAGTTYNSPRELSMRKAAELYVEAAKRGCADAKQRLQELDRIARA
ncbi:hypothetical protein RI367_007113 [Sorochytrium milnesiophthora]